MTDNVNPALRSHAIKLLTKREYSVQKLRDALIKRFPGQAEYVPQLIQELQATDAVSDERFARAFTRHLQLTTSAGPRMIQQKLTQQGVSANLAQATVDAEYEQEDHEILQRITRKKEEYTRRKPGISSYELRGKLSQYFLRKGYHLRDISDMIDTVLNA